MVPPDWSMETRGEASCRWMSGAERGKARWGRDPPPSMAEQVPPPSPSPGSLHYLGHSSLWASGQAAEFGLRVQCCPPCCSGAPLSIRLPGEPCLGQSSKPSSRLLALGLPGSAQAPAAPSSLARPLQFQLLLAWPAVLSTALPVLATREALPLLGRSIIILSNIIKTN